MYVDFQLDDSLAEPIHYREIISMLVNFEKTREGGVLNSICTNLNWLWQFLPDNLYFEFIQC